jgi:uncharacterized membrane protein
MSFRLQLLVGVVISILTVVLALLDTTLIGPVVSLMGVSVVPGWLLTHVLFGSHDEPDQVTRSILVLGLGAVLVALELIVLPVVGIRISRESVALAAAVTSWLLVGLLVFRLRMDRSDLDRVPVLSAMPLSFIAVLVLYAVVPLHQPLVRESYTEFYATSLSEAKDDQAAKVDLVIVSHEQEDQIYAVFCRDISGSERLLVESSLEPESSLVTQLFVSPPQSDWAGKMWLFLYREQDDTPYRWIELIGGGCDLLSPRGGL